MKVLQNTNGRFPRMGEIIYWEFKDGFTWNLQTLLDLVEQFKIEFNFQPLSYMERLVNVLNRAEKWKEYDLIWRSKGNDVYVGLVNISNGIEIKNTITITFGKDDTPRWSIKTGMEELAQRLADEIQRWAFLIDVQVFSKQLVSYIMCMGMRLRKRGGFYFVPEKKREKIDHLEDFIKECGGITLGRIGLIDEERSRNEIATVLKEEVEEFVANIRKYISEMQGGKRFRNDGYDTRLAELYSMRNKVQFILNAIGVSAELLKSQLDVVEEEMVTMKLKKEAEI